MSVSSSTSQSFDHLMQGKGLLGQLAVMFCLFPSSLPILKGLFKKHTLYRWASLAGLGAFLQERLVACFQFLNAVQGGIKA